VILKSGLKIGVAFGEKSLIRGIASREVSNSIVFYYICASKIWPEKWGGLW
jgi:hypothetical protein